MKKSILITILTTSLLTSALAQTNEYITPFHPTPQRAMNLSDREAYWKELYGTNSPSQLQLASLSPSDIFRWQSNGQKWRIISNGVTYVQTATRNTPTNNPDYATYWTGVICACKYSPKCDPTAARFSAQAQLSTNTTWSANARLGVALDIQNILANTFTSQPLSITVVKTPIYSPLNSLQVKLKK